MTNSPVRVSHVLCWTQQCSFFSILYLVYILYNLVLKPRAHHTQWLCQFLKLKRASVQNTKHRLALVKL